MKYSWHRETFKATLNNLSRHALALQGLGFDLEGWYEWFELTHPEIWKKYLALCERMNKAWGDTDDKAMAEFKKNCSEYENTYEWVLGQYLEFLRKELNKEFQESMLPI